MSFPYEVGPQYSGTGGHTTSARIGTSGALVVTDAHGHFFEAARLALTATGGGLFSATTAAAGVAPGTALSTTPPFAQWNPQGSAVVLSVVVTRFGLLSGTLGVGTVFYATVAVQTTKPSTGTQLTANAQVAGSLATPKGQAFQGSTLAAAPVALAPAFSVAANPTGVLKDQVDGEILVLPGGVLVMQEIGAAGTSPLGFFGATWEEVPLLY